MDKERIASLLTRTLVAVIIALSINACANLPDNSQRVKSRAFTNTENTTLGKGVSRQIQANTQNSGFYLLGNGLDAFVARAALAAAAERSIDTQYYLIHDDVVGALFIEQLYQAANRGVRVRILVDDIDQGDRDLGAAVLDTHPNIEVRIFNPFDRKLSRAVQYLSGFGKQTRRAHNKSFTVDNQATILGGRNIGDEYFNADPDLAFIDMDVLAAGPVAQQVSRSFDQYWNHALAYPISALVEQQPTATEIAEKEKQFKLMTSHREANDYKQHLLNSELVKQIRQNSVHYSIGFGEVVADAPDKLTVDTNNTDYHLTEQLGPYLEGVEKELIIFSPYFVPGKSGVAFLKSLRDKGVKVRILTNSLSSTDVAVVHAGYARYRRVLLKMGVELYELNRDLNEEDRKALQAGGIGKSKASLHAKVFVLDRRQVFIGSLNLDPRSISQNTEIGVIYESEEHATSVAKSFDLKIDQIAFRLALQSDKHGNEKIVWHGIVDGEQQELSTEPYSSFWQRFSIGFMRLLPIESQI